MNKWGSLVVSLWCGHFEMYQSANDDFKCYRTFGNHDMITIAPIAGNTATNIFNGMWEKTNTYSQNIRAGESIHNLFAVAENNCDQFWSRETPYLFVSAIQINFNLKTSYEKQLNAFKNELKDFLSANDLIESVDYAIYNSLDCGDVLLFIRTNKYEYGANLIHQVTIKSNYKHYSYSVCGLNTEMILHHSDSREEIIPKVAVCSVLADATNYYDWFKEFSKEYPNDFLNSSGQLNHFSFDKDAEEYIHLTRLGNEDVCINIFNCKVKHFVKMLHEDNGVFSYTNDLVSAAFVRLRITFDTNIIDIVPVKKRQFSKGYSLINKLSDEWHETLKNTSNQYVFKAISEVLAASENLENKEFAFEIQDCIRNVFPLFVKKINEYSTATSNYTNDNFNNDLISFTSGLMSIANGSLHADKLFINVPGFNAVTYDAPAKLLAYYTAFIQKIVSTFNDETDLDYKFLLCPDLYLGISVTPIFNYDISGSQLLKAQIPINKLFNPQILLMELSHEVAHFVGAELRSRRERKYYLAEMIAYTFADRLVRPKIFEDVDIPHSPEYIELDEFKYDEKPYLDISEMRIYAERDVISTFLPVDIKNISIDSLLRHEWKPLVDYIKDKLLFDLGEKDSELYLDKIQKKFKENATSLLVGMATESLTNVVCEIIAPDADYTATDELLALSTIIDRHIDEILLQDYFPIIERSCKLSSESFADLFMLCITNDPIVYLHSIYETELEAYKQNDIDDTYFWDYPLVGEMRKERILSVLQSMDYNINKLKLQALKQGYCEGFIKFLNSLETYIESENEELRATSIWAINSNSNYLSICREIILQKSEELAELRKLYRSVTAANDMNNCIKAFRKCAFEFRKNLIPANLFE